MAGAAQIPFPWVTGLDPVTQQELERDFEALREQIHQGTSPFDAIIDPTLVADNPGEHLYTCLRTLLVGESWPVSHTFNVGVKHQATIKITEATSVNSITGRGNLALFGFGPPEVLGSVAGWDWAELFCDVTQQVYYHNLAFDPVAGCSGVTKIQSGGAARFFQCYTGANVQSLNDTTAGCSAKARECRFNGTLSLTSGAGVGIENDFFECEANGLSYGTLTTLRWFGGRINGTVTVTGSALASVIAGGAWGVVCSAFGSSCVFNNLNDSFAGTVSITSTAIAVDLVGNWGDVVISGTPTAGAQRTFRGSCQSLDFTGPGLVDVASTLSNFGRHVILRGDGVRANLGMTAGRIECIGLTNSETTANFVSGAGGFYTFDASTHNNIFVFAGTHGTSFASGSVVLGGTKNLVITEDGITIDGVFVTISNPGNFPAPRDGVDGEDGLDGFPGKPGAAGATGLTGPPGAATPGIPGQDGEDGLDGFPGPPGPAGLTGPTGPPGTTSPGSPGLDGEDGLDGLPGPPGATGPTGAQGLSIRGQAGEDGEDGLDGLPGQPGATGAVGAQGQAGIPRDGVDGEDGLDGFPGPTGPPGATGAQGVQGRPVDGVDGEDGLDGITVVGPQGPQGIQGLQGRSGMDGFDGDDGADGAPGAAGLPGGLIYQALVDFGAVPVYEKTFSITDANAKAGMKIMASRSADPTTNNLADEAEMDDLVCAAYCAVNGTITLTCKANPHTGPVAGKYNVNYALTPFTSPNYTVCTSATHPSNPHVGDKLFETDTGKELTYQSSTTGWTPPWNSKWGVLSDVTATASQTVGASIALYFSGFNVAFTAVGNRIYRYSVKMAFISGAPTTQQGTIRIVDGSGTLAPNCTPNVWALNSQNTGQSFEFSGTETGLAAGSVTRQVFEAVSAGTSTFYADTSLVAHYIIEDYGPNGNPL